MNDKAFDKKEDRHLRRIYGKLPTRGDLLHRQLDRTYFDSGDFALAAAHEPSNIGNVRTGTQHPRADSISHPSAPVPSGSNVKDNANKSASSEDGSPHLTSRSSYGLGSEPGCTEDQNTSPPKSGPVARVDAATGKKKQGK